MDNKTEKQLKDKVMDCCSGSRSSYAFSYMNDDQYIGYQTAMVVANSYKINATVQEKFEMVKILFAEGKL